jgi:DNA-binding MarR family transcriptional regulator
LFTSLAPAFVGGTLHHSSPALAGLIVFAVFGAAAAAQTLTRRCVQRGADAGQGDDDPALPDSRAAGSADDLRWADLADLALIIAREIQFRGYRDEEAVALSPSEGVVMRYLQDRPSATPSVIAAATGLQRTNLSTVLRSLEDKGLIERGASPDDGRGVTVRATARGRSNYELARREWGAAVAAAAGGDTKRLEAALTVLRSVANGLVAARPAGDGLGRS